MLCVCSAVSSRCTKRSSNAQLLFSFSWLPLLADVGYVVHGLAKARTMPSTVEFLVSVVGAYAHYSVRPLGGRDQRLSSARAEPLRPAFSKTGRGATKSLVDNPKIITTAAVLASEAEAKPTASGMKIMKVLTSNYLESQKS